MSRQLVFWKNTDGFYMDSREIYMKLCNGEKISGLENLDTDGILKRLSRIFWTGGLTNIILNRKKVRLRLKFMKML